MFFKERVSIEFDVICVQIKTCKCINEFQVRGRVLDLSSVGQIMKTS